ncbi:MAG: Z1 domain-containing protein [Anaerovoracaceae bacterium]
MIDKQTKYYESIKRTSDLLYRLFNGNKMTHSEVVSEAKKLLPIVLHTSNLESCPDYDEILKGAVDLFEIEVGIKTYSPNEIAKDKQSKYWLYKVKPTIPHTYFDRYKLYLGSEGFPQKTIDDIMLSCEHILAYCANPKCTTSLEKKRGLVMGDVQSGKTANYLGLINMAFDYGYKIVVLLAGTTNSLRMQTQKRMDKGVIGAKSDSIGNEIEYIGVGFDKDEHFAVPFTNQQNDFAKFIQCNLNASIGDFNKPVVLVVKKVKSILESVKQRLQSALNEQGLDAKSMLIIDDEADNASINTAKPENEPTAINRCIRAIFNKYPIVSYVGYTATPFANIFINPYDDEENYDLFPADFIVQLNAPDTYFGGRRVFPKNDDTLPICLRLINEEEPLFLPVIHEKDYQLQGLPESLIEAIHCFLINCVIRTIRGQSTKHRTLMINITRYNKVQEQVQERVVAYIEKLTCSIEQLSSMGVDAFVRNAMNKKIFDLYQSDFYKSIRDGGGESDTIPITWNEIQAGLYDEIRSFMTIVINSRNGKMNQRTDAGINKRFEYEEYESVGARVIAIGGMVLSRGLTLEGLMVSYYSRNAGTYDTLLQMCRWFGYRPKYEDLCRIYLSQENIDRFDAVLYSVEDLKEQFAEMERQDKKPIDFGMMIKESPDTLETSLLITARAKMRGTEVIEYHLNYGGVYADTSKLSIDPAVNIFNYNAFLDFYHNLHFSFIRNRYMEQNVSKYALADFVSQLKIPYVNKKFDTEGLSEYIRNSEVFPTWDVVIATGDSHNFSKFLDVQGLKAVERSFHVKNRSDNYIRIGGSNNRVMEPGILNSGLWLSEGDKNSILLSKRASSDNEVASELSATDYLRKRNCPIFIIYPIDLKTEPNNNEIVALGEKRDVIEEYKKNLKNSFGSELPLMAFAFGFPFKESGVMVNYRANRIKLDEFNRNLEIDDDGEGTEDEDN